VQENDYIQKNAWTTLEDGKAIKSAVKNYNRVYQLGHQLRKESSISGQRDYRERCIGKSTYVSLAPQQE